MAKFTYCPLVWMFSSTSSLKKIENFQKRALRFLCNNYEISYEELLLKSDRATMNVNRLRILCIELFKTNNNFNSEFMRDLFSLRETSRLIREKYMLNLKIPGHNQVTFGSQSLRVFGRKVWNSLPYHIKSSGNLESFKMITKNWSCTRCSCEVCNAPEREVETASQRRIWDC